MKVYLDKEKNYYKANLHCHSRYSDGRATREEIKEQYKAHGYSAVAFTDHEHSIDTSALTDDDFVAILGCELGIYGKKIDTDSPLPSGSQVHLCMYAKDPKNLLTPCYNASRDSYKFEDVRHLVVKDTDDFPRVYSAEGINEMVRTAHKQGFLVSYNHPSWSLENAQQYLEYEDFDFVEIYNTGCDKTGYPSTEYAFDDMMKAGKRTYGICTDDNHNIFGFDTERSDSFGGWVMINAPKLDYSSLIEGLERGDFYASTGPEIYSLTVEDDLTVKVKFSPAVRAVILTQGRRTASSYTGAEGKASFKIYPQDVRFRIRIDDEHGKSAYSQIYDIPEDIIGEVRRIAAEKAAAKAEEEKAAKEAAEKAEAEKTVKQTT